MRALLLLLCLSPCSCITQTLWQAELAGDVHVQVDTAQFAVETMAVGERDDPAVWSGLAPAHELVLQAELRSSAIDAGQRAQVPQRPWFVLRPFAAAGAEVVAGLLDGDLIGEVDRCDLVIDWYGGHETDPHWEATLVLEGWLAPWLVDAEIDAEAAAALLASPAAVPVAALPAELAARLEAVDAIDWRVLCPQRHDGRGTALACCYDRAAGVAADAAAGIDVLLRLDRGDRPQFLLVPLAALPLLAAIHRRTDTLLPRFLCEQHFLPLLFAQAPAQAAPLRLPAMTMLRLTTHLRQPRRRGSSIVLKVLLTPFALAADAALNVLAQWIAPDDCEDDTVRFGGRR